MKIQNALISVTDKTGILELAQFLHSQAITIISTGGTAKTLQDANIPVTEISQYTGYPEMLDGRLKTLHPKVHGGLLHLRDNPQHTQQTQQHNIPPIDLLIVNLYPFEQTITQPNFTHQQAIENIDIGGPAMLRSASKNHQTVTVIVDPADYPTIQNEIATTGNTTPQTRQKLAAKAFRHTAHYDATIARYLTHQAEPQNPILHEHAGISGKLAQPLRYGENPHQQAALYGTFHRHFHQLHGKELSYNNILDISAAASLILEFQNQNPTLAILKHTNPCGIATAPTLHQAWNLAYATDTQAPFGGIIITNHTLDATTAHAISEIFSEVIIAPTFTDEAKTILQKKKNLRLIQNQYTPEPHPYDLKTVLGGFLLQQRDTTPDDPSQWKIVTQRKPTTQEMDAITFGWKIIKHIKSNAILYCNHQRTLGIGAGQMSRIDSAQLAIWKATQAQLPLQGSCIASDAFFPFPDAILAAAQAGATCAVQPGGSIRDEEVIQAANNTGLAMVFTGKRHFRH